MSIDWTAPTSADEAAGVLEAVATDNNHRKMVARYRRLKVSRLLHDRFGDAHFGSSQVQALPVGCSQGHRSRAWRRVPRRSAVTSGSSGTAWARGVRSAGSTLRWERASPPICWRTATKSSLRGEWQWAARRTAATTTRATCRACERTGDAGEPT